MKESTCYHCGNSCEEEIIVHEDKNFCCTGCRSVYILLFNNDLCNYYDIENQPGLLIEKVNKEKFDYLDDPGVLADVLDFQNKQTATVSFVVPQIHCYSCLWLLEMFHKIHPGVKKSKVNYISKEMSLTYSKEDTTLSEIVAKLASIGYEPRIDAKTKSSKGPTNKRLLIQIGVAGFGFGNIMFMSFPEYFTGGQGIPKDLYQYFGLVNLFLATILVFFSARDYFTSAIRSLKYKKLNLDIPITLGISAIYISSAHEVLTGQGFGYFDSLAGLVFFLLLGKYFQDKTFAQFNFERDYKAYFPLSAKRIEDDNRISNVPLHQLKVGDKLQIRNQEIIPADGLLLSKKAQVDYSFVTGESLPENASEKALLYAGGKIKGEAVAMIISQLPSQSYLTKLWNNSSEEKSTKISSLSDKVGHWFTVFVLALAFVSAIYWFPKDHATSVKVFTSVLIIACPCALALAIPITYGNTMRILGNKGFYLKNAFVVELLSQINTIILDKTGTLTYAEKGEVHFIGQLSSEEKNIVSSLLINSIHPLSNKVLSFLAVKSNLNEVKDFEEVDGKGLSGTIENKEIKVGSFSWVTGKEQTNKGTTSEVHLSINGEYKGVFEIRNSYRKGIREFFNRLKPNYVVEVASGDNESEKERLKELSGIDSLYFNQTPFSKKEKVEELQKREQKVMMVGDGLNDAGALLTADVGVAITDTSVGFTPASDVVLEAENLQQLPSFLRFSHHAMKVVYACFTLSLLYNVVGLFFAVRGELSPVISAILMPISSVSVLLLSVGLLKLYQKSLENKSNG